MKKSVEEVQNIASEMLSNGMSPSFVFKWVRDRIEDPKKREKIMNAINVNAPKTTTNEGQLKKDREVRNAKFLQEDLNESVIKCNYVGYLSIGLGIIWMISNLVFNTGINPLHIINVIVGIGIIVFIKIMDMRNRSIVGIIFIIFLAILIVNYFMFGTPNRLIPNLGETRTRKWINIVTVINDLSPIVYYFLQAAVSLSTLKVIHYIGKWKTIPRSIREALQH